MEVAEKSHSREFCQLRRLGTRSWMPPDGDSAFITTRTTPPSVITNMLIGANLESVLLVSRQAGKNFRSDGSSRSPLSEVRGRSLPLLQTRNKRSTLPCAVGGGGIRRLSLQALSSQYCPARCFFLATRQQSSDTAAYEPHNDHALAQRSALPG